MLERTHPPLRVLVIDEIPIRRSILLEGLADAGLAVVITLANTSGLVQEINRIDPDVILIDLESPGRDVLEQMFQMSRVVRRPIAMFVDQSDRSTIEAAIDAGVSAYIVDGLKKERLKPLLDMTVSRFNAFDRMRPRLYSISSSPKAKAGFDSLTGDEVHSETGGRRRLDVESTFPGELFSPQSPLKVFVQERIREAGGSGYACLRMERMARDVEQSVADANAKLGGKLVDAARGRIAI